jgi:hypothetical protein
MSSIPRSSIVESACIGPCGRQDKGCAIVASSKTGGQGRAPGRL